MNEFNQLFLETYEGSRARFRAWLPEIARLRPDAVLHQHTLQEFPELTIDWITASGRDTNDKMLVFTTGEHGVEGYVGSAMLELFLRKFLPRLDPATTGLTLVHAINPWGMKHHRRTNPHNVDLNRNFVLDESLLDPAYNPLYAKIAKFVGPEGMATYQFYRRFEFLVGYLLQILRFGRVPFWAGKVLGQYAHPQGIHYGGRVLQEEVRVLQRIYRHALASGRKVLHLDMHTGYGPRYQMTIVNSPLEPKSSVEFASELGYPLVAAMNPEEFYAVLGDMVDCVYLLRGQEFPDTELYATAFEFGTFGAGHWKNYRSMRAMVLENQLYWHGAASVQDAGWIRKEFLESFSPSEVKWREKAIADAEQAMQAILRMVEFATKNVHVQEDQ